MQQLFLVVAWLVSWFVALALCAFVKPSCGAAPVVGGARKWRDTKAPGRGPLTTALARDGRFRRNAEARAKTSSKEIYERLDRHEHVVRLFHEHYLQMLDMDRRVGFTKRAPEKDALLLDICAAPSAFSAYWLDCMPTNRAIGVSLAVEKGGMPNMIRVGEQVERFEYLEADIVADAGLIAVHLAGRKADFACHGCHDMTESKSVYAGHRKHDAETALWLAALKLGLTHLKEDGTFLFKVSAKNTDRMFVLMDLLLDHFSELRPVKSRFMHGIRSTFYCVCTGRRVTERSASDRLEKFLARLKTDGLIAWADEPLVHLSELSALTDLLCEQVFEVQTQAIENTVAMVDHMEARPNRPKLLEVL